MKVPVRIWTLSKECEEGTVEVVGPMVTLENLHSSWIDEEVGMMVGDPGLSRYKKTRIVHGVTHIA